MKRTLPLLALLGLVGCISMPKLHIGAGLSGVMPEDTDNLDGTYQLDFMVRVDVAMLQAEVSVGQKSYDYQADAVSSTETLEVMPLAAVIKYGIGASAAKLVIGAGIVQNINDLDDASGAVSNVEDALGYRITAGGQIGLPMGLGLVVELMYDFTEADVDDAATDDVNMNELKVRLAATYQF